MERRSEENRNEENRNEKLESEADREESLSAFVQRVFQDKPKINVISEPYDSVDMDE